MNNQAFERIPIYEASEAQDLSNPFFRFKFTSDNGEFRAGFFSYLNLFILLLVYPGLSLIGVGDTAKLLNNIDQAVLAFMLISTILMQWVIFLINFVGVYTEKTGLAGLRLVRIRGTDFAWAFTFLLVSNLILSGLAWFLAQVGLPMPGEIAFLIPEDTFGRVLWVLVSFTAGFCEEVAFRGYLMTRLRLLGKFKSWVIPTIISVLVFGVCHAYQGLPGFIVISVYGLMFSLLYIKTGRLWPCIIAHFFQDFSALFIPQ
ncbi:MAG: CPBP family intramembrane metalloprotease [candidate division Zixibacteria bacterium]|nr:CPBP family intramembrane metalloprotease [candidate division Zixibacteria bacterium]